MRHSLVTSAFEHRGKVMEDVRAAIDETKPKANYDHRLMGHNNDPTVSFADIQKILHMAEVQISQRMNH